MKRFVFSFALIAPLVACGPASQDPSQVAYRTEGHGGGQNQGPTGRFPTEPNAEVTPGALCQHADEYRYPEHIAYCKRDVDSSTKRSIIKEYDDKFGYNIERMNRADFKIDHFIPLSVGGANERENLWPQHESVYVYTDPVESTLSELMIHAKITQAEAIETIKYAKFHLDETGRINDRLQAKMHQQN